VWEEIEMIVDSGAPGPVVGEDMIKAIEATNVKSDVSYKLTDGSRLLPHGETCLQSIHRPRASAPYGCGSNRRG